MPTPLISDAISETALIPLVMKARESQNPQSIWDDPTSHQLLQRLNISLKQYGKAPFSAAGIILRAQYLDRMARNFIRNHQHKHPVIIQLGCGLDTRFERTAKDSTSTFYDLDLPEIIALRRKFLPPCNNHHYIAASMLDKTWMEEIQEKHSEQPILIIIEGVLMYFKPHIAQQFFEGVVDHFQNTEIYFDIVADYMKGRGKQHDTLKNTNADFNWGIANPLELEEWNNRLQCINRYYFFRDEAGRWPYLQFLAKIMPSIGKSCMVLHYHIQPSPALSS